MMRGGTASLSYSYGMGDKRCRRQHMLYVLYTKAVGTSGHWHSLWLTYEQAWKVMDLMSHLERLDEQRVGQQLLGAAPVVVDHLAATGRVLDPAQPQQTHQDTAFYLRTCRTGDTDLQAVRVQLPVARLQVHPSTTATDKQDPDMLPGLQLVALPNSRAPTSAA